MTKSRAERALSERWLPVPGWEGWYEVSDLGRIRGLKTHTILRPVPRNRYGHMKVSLTRPGARQYASVGRVVALAFLGAPPPGQQVRHGPGGASDNRLVNLCYGTPQENAKDKLRDGTHARGERQGAAKLTWPAVREIRRRHSAGETRRTLADAYAVSIPNIDRIIRGETWREED